LVVEGKHKLLGSKRAAGNTDPQRWGVRDSALGKDVEKQADAYAPPPADFDSGFPHAEEAEARQLLICRE
jgi:hypothetical protein